MVNILQTEFFRLKKSVLFWSLFAVCAILPLISVLLELAVFSGLSILDIGVEYDTADIVNALNPAGQALTSIPNLSADFQLFALICTSIFLCKEFSGGTYRNMILANRSRSEVYFSFLLMAVTVGSTYLGVAYVSTVLFNGAIFGFGMMTATEVVAACVIALALGLVSVIFMQTLMCMFMFLTRKLSVSLICPLLIGIIAPSVIYSFIETFSTLGMISVTDTSWIPLYNLNLLDLTNIDGALIGKILLYLIPLSALFGYLGWVLFRKADLK